MMTVISEFTVSAANTQLVLESGVTEECGGSLGKDSFSEGPLSAAGVL